MAWDPTRDLLTMQERLESLFGRATPGWLPPVDLAEMADRFVLTVELPGLAREDLQIHLEGDTLTVRGRRPPPAVCPERYHQLERGQGAFSRAFRFAVPVRGDAITAEMADGILTVTIPKNTAAGNRRIDID